ncbi:hypothetical protein PPL_02590 [Heterostelium album PN500]|uniref:Uncharacterized protein n=1 Tax=Heterostelium pallidum (strain ATCC 26659 / Pp 5 / PN500) TaxID=670386 RepID=D3B2H7_HETP5|nr:hypothetical protein PPL_02590 [Heterostelium album PN500]EFA83525.1 hypothetical protein PPL_02590 [Heterostelium album PN500]|eukprot:XP_020435642.1 hypothetical protein PPL_02590 [Heterostelium album PN500]
MKMERMYEYLVYFVVIGFYRCCSWWYPSLVVMFRFMSVQKITLKNYSQRIIDDGDESDRVELEPYTIAENITIKKYLSKHERFGFKNRLAYVRGSVLVYELEISIANAMLSDWFSSRWAPCGLGTDFGRYLQRPGTVDLTVAPGTIVQQADQSFRPYGRVGLAANATGVTFPTMVIEVGVSQSLNSLHEKAQRYLLPTTDI